jgi:hypothetical protein
MARIGAAEGQIARGASAADESAYGESTITAAYRGCSSRKFNFCAIA